MAQRRKAMYLFSRQLRVIGGSLECESETDRVGGYRTWVSVVVVEVGLGLGCLTEHSAKRLLSGKIEEGVVVEDLGRWKGRVGSSEDRHKTLCRI